MTNQHTAVVAESDFMRRCRKKATALGARLFRNNVGTAWVGRVKGRGQRSIVLEDPRPFHAGLQVGSSDLIGWVPVVVTPDMVGQTIAVFAAVETKTAKGKTTEAQQMFIEAVRQAGGYAGVARTDEDLHRILNVNTTTIA